MTPEPHFLKEVGLFCDRLFVVTSADQYDFLRSGLGVVEASRSLIRLTGEDRLEWLQGQASNDMAKLSGGQVSFCLCSPTGQIEAVVEAWSLEDNILLSTDKACGAALMNRIDHMVIMEDVEGEDISNTLRLTWLIGNGEPELAGADYVLRAEHFIEVWQSESQEGPTYPPVDEAFGAWRLERGIPVWGVDMGPKTLPPEMGPRFEAKYVSYTKGCYTGQEILQRIHSRGHTNWTWAGLRAEAELAVGANVEHHSRASAGIVTSSAHSPALGWIGSARLRNEVGQENSQVQIDGQDVQVLVMPLITRLDQPSA